MERLQYLWYVNPHVHPYSWVCMYRCCCHLHPRVDVKENTAGKHPDVVRPEATSRPLPYFTLTTGEYIHWVFSHTVICLPRSSTYPPFFCFFSPHKAKPVQTFLYIIAFLGLPVWESGVKKFAEKLNPFKLKLYIYRQRHSVLSTQGHLQRKQTEHAYVHSSGSACAVSLFPHQRM